MSKTLSIVTPAEIFISGLERTSAQSRSLVKCVAPIMIVVVGAVLALSGQWTAPTMSSQFEGKTAAEMATGWSFPTKVGGPLVSADLECKFPTVSASTVKDMIAAQMSCGSCS